MNLKVLMLILVYYMCLSAVLLMGGASIGDTTMSGGLNSSSLQPGEVTTGGIFGSGLSFTRFAGLVTIGVGLPSDTPSWASAMFTIWSIAWLTFTIGFFVSAIWNG